MDKTNDIIEQRKQKIKDLKKGNINPFPNDFVVKDTIKNILNTIEENPDSIEENNPVFSAAGRMMAINRFGKAAFIRFRDRTGQLQSYIRTDRVGAEGFSLFKQLDIGDFIGIKGGMFKTRTGEWTLLAAEIKLICKAVRPLPEKFHGLKDPEKRYRQRYIDMIMNSNTRNIFQKRSKTVQEIRKFFLNRDFLEVETPMMQPVPGGAEATPFKTYHNALGMNLFLRIAPELYLKRLVIGGFERVFELNRNFRNEGVSTKHNPEFTMLEFYQAYATYEDLMDMTEEMLRTVAVNITGSEIINFQGNSINLGGKWSRIGMFESLEKIGEVPSDILDNRKKLLDFAVSKGIVIKQKTGTKLLRPGKIIAKLFDILVEPKLIQPTYITGYPVEISPLSRKNNDDPTLTDRFELFIAGHEIANGFSELNDPEDQRERFLQQATDREAGDEEAHYMDEDYVKALEYGMPPTAGEGIGIDRLAMLLTDSASIREVILFPHMKKTKK